MVETAVPKVTRVASVKEFVHRLATKGSEDIEKLLLHVLDSAKNYWNEKATHYLRELKRSDLSEEQVRDLKKKYDQAFDNVTRILRMRHGVGISKKVL